MSQLKFFRKLGEVWVFDLTWLDRTDARQSLAGVSDLAANWYTLAGASLVTGDAAGCTIVQSAPGTEGDFKYERLDLALFSKGSSYLLEFVATINSKLVKCPERRYITVYVN